MGRWPRSGLTRNVVGGDQNQQLWKFLGKLQAHGLELDQGDAQDPATQDKIRWIRQSDGAVVAEHFGSDYPVSLGGGNDLNAHQLKARVMKPGAAQGEAGITAQAFTKLAGIIDLPASVGAYAISDAGVTESRTIIDEAGNSNFLQVVNAGEVYLSFGSGNCTWPGGTAQSSVLGLGHGMPTAADFVVAMSAGTGGPTFNVVGQPNGATQVAIVSYQTTGAAIPAGSTRGIYFLAVGVV